jgi:hypothetical protein
MNAFYRLVIELYKQRLTTTHLDDESATTALKMLKNAVTAAKVTGQPYGELLELIADVEQLRALDA